MEKSKIENCKKIFLVEGMGGTWYIHVRSANMSWWQFFKMFCAFYRINIICLNVQNSNIFNFKHWSLAHWHWALQNPLSFCQKFKPVTIIYKGLIDNFKINIQILKEIWNQELEFKIQPKQWKIILEISLDLKLRLNQPKIVFRLYWIPERLYRKKRLNSDRYWRCNMENRTLTHTICTCTIIQLFWLDVFKVLM